jgi:leader peptidase (prepilin peptidase)/N-methyltransferase
MAVVYQRVRGIEGLGFGDVKMLGFLGAFMGFEATLLTLMLGSIIGTVLGLFWIKLRKQDAATYELPFGSFLGAAALIVVFAGPGLLR